MGLKTLRTSRTGEMVLCVKCLPGVHEDPREIPQVPCKTGPGGSGQKYQVTHRKTEGRDSWCLMGQLALLMWSEISKRACFIQGGR